MISAIAAGAVPVSASVRSVFCVPGPPSRAPGTAVVELVAEPVHQLRTWPRSRPRSPA